MPLSVDAKGPRLPPSIYRSRSRYATINAGRVHFPPSFIPSSMPTPVCSFCGNENNVVTRPMSLHFFSPVPPLRTTSFFSSSGSDTVSEHEPSPCETLVPATEKGPCPSPSLLPRPSPSSSRSTTPQSDLTYSLSPIPTPPSTPEPLPPLAPIPRTRLRPLLQLPRPPFHRRWWTRCQEWVYRQKMKWGVCLPSQTTPSSDSTTYNSFFRVPFRTYGSPRPNQSHTRLDRSSPPPSPSSPPPPLPTHSAAWWKRWTTRLRPKATGWDLPEPTVLPSATASSDLNPRLMCQNCSDTWQYIVSDFVRQPFPLTAPTPRPPPGPCVYDRILDMYYGQAVI